MAYFVMYFVKYLMVLNRAMEKAILGVCLRVHIRNDEIHVRTKHADLAPRIAGLQCSS